MINPVMPGGNKKVTQKVCLSMCDLFVTTRHKGVIQRVAYGSVCKICFLQRNNQAIEISAF